MRSPPACRPPSPWRSPTGRSASALRARIARPWFRPYLSDDVVGAEIGGAVKNVLAIACGVVEGRRLGQNARSALISRGFAEMTRFGLARGARAETLAGLSGLGDLVLTCSSTSSRNFSLGKGLGEGREAAELLADRRTVAEGAYTAPVLAQGGAGGRGRHADRRRGLRAPGGRGERGSGGGAAAVQAAAVGRDLNPSPGEGGTRGSSERGLGFACRMTLSSRRQKSQQMPLFSQSP